MAVDYCQYRTSRHAQQPAPAAWPTNKVLVIAAHFTDTDSKLFPLKLRSDHVQTIISFNMGHALDHSLPTCGRQHEQG